MSKRLQFKVGQEKHDDREHLTDRCKPLGL
jgi:hypothetical protein